MEVDQFTMGIFVVVALAPVHGNLSSTDHVGDDLVRGGIEVQGGGPGVNEDNLDQPCFFGHFSPEVLQATCVDDCWDLLCIESSCDVDSEIRTTHNDDFVVEDLYIVDGLVHRVASGV